MGDYHSSLVAEEFFPDGSWHWLEKDEFLIAMVCLLDQACSKTTRTGVCISHCRYHMGQEFKRCPEQFALLHIHSLDRLSELVQRSLNINQVVVSSSWRK